MGSVNEEINRIADAKVAIEEAIEYCGVDVPDGNKINTFSDYIRAIPAAVFSQFNVDIVGGDNKYIKSISQANGVISASAGDTTTTVSKNSTALVTSGGVYNYISSWNGVLAAKADKDLTSTLILQGTAIPNNADLNTVEYLKIGVYNCKTYGTAISLKNCPVNNGFRMEVYSYQSSNTDDSILTTATHVYRLRKIIKISGEQYYQYVYSAAEKGVFTYGDWQYIPTTKATIDTTDTNGSTVTNGDASTPVYIDSTGKFASCTGVYNDSQDCIPKSCHTTSIEGYNLGSSTKQFNTTYTRHIDTISGYNLRLKASGTEHINMVGGVVSTTAHIIPTKNITYNLGSADYTWKNIYASNFIENGASLSTIYADKSYADYCSSYLHSANRAQFCKPAGVTIEYSTNGGSAWVDYGATDDQKINFFSGISQEFVLGKKLSTRATSSDMLRITMDATAMGIYASCKCLLLNISTNGSSNFRVKVEKSMKGSVDTFDTLIESQTLTGWSGWNRIPIGYSFGGNNTQIYHIAKLRLTFSSDGAGSSYTSGAHAKVLDMEVLGGTYWAAPHTMAKTGHLYTWDTQGNAIFGGSINATSIKKTNSSDSYVLLGGGGHKSINNFVTTFSKSTGNINSNLTGSEHYPYICRLGYRGDHENLPEGCSYGNLVHFTNSSSDTAFELLGDYDNKKLLFRSGNWKANSTGTINSAQWKQIAFTDGTDATGTWPISITGNATGLISAGVQNSALSRDLTKYPQSKTLFTGYWNHNSTGRYSTTWGTTLDISHSTWYQRLAFSTEGRIEYFRGIDSNNPDGTSATLSKIGDLAYTSDIPTSLKNPYSLTIQANGKTIGSYDGSSTLTANITAASLGLSTVFDYKGITTTQLTDGSVTTPIIINGLSYTQKKGDVVIVDGDTDKEYFWNGLKWEELGRTIDLSGYAPSSHTHEYLPLRGGALTGTLTSQNIIPSIHNNYNLGGSTLKWKNVYATTFYGALSGNATSASTVNIQTNNTALYYPMIFTSSTTETNAASLYIDGLTGTTSTSTGIRYNPFANTCYCSGGFYELSDEKLKNFGNDIEVDLDKLSKLSKKYFTWKNDESNTQHIGISAQEVQDIYPELVNVIDEEGHLSVSYDKLSVVALKGIDVLNDKIKSLEERLERLEKIIG